MEAIEYKKMFALENKYWWYRGLHELVIDSIIRTKPNQSLKILDAGCGTGRMLELLQEFGEVQGIDYAEEALDACRQRGLTSICQGDLSSLEFPQATYDLIISLDVICCREIKEDFAVVSRLYQALKTGGILILNLPAFDLLRRQHDTAVHSIRRYRKYRTLVDLRTIGFKIERAGYRMPVLFFIIMLRKFLDVFFASKKSDDFRSDLRPLPDLVNSLLLAGLRLENKLFIWGLNMPVGSSLFITCRK